MKVVTVIYELNVIYVRTNINIVGVAAFSVQSILECILAFCLSSGDVISVEGTKPSIRSVSAFNGGWWITLDFKCKSIAYNPQSCTTGDFPRSDDKRQTMCRMNQFIRFDLFAYFNALA